MAYRLRFGSYDLPSTLSIAENRVVNVVPRQKVARADGARVLRGSLDQRIVRVTGGLTLGPIGGVTIRTVMDALYTALHPNAPATMYVGRDDRYLRSVSCLNFPEITGPTEYDNLVRLDLDFVSGDPYFYSTTLTTDTWTVTATGQARSITPGGFEPPLPTFRITVGVTGTAAFTILNNTTGKSFTITGNVTAGDIIVVDCLAQTVTISGVDRMDLFDGIWVALVAGVANDMREAYTGTATITQVVTEFRARYI